MGDIVLYDKGSCDPLEHVRDSPPPFVREAET